MNPLMQVEKQPGPGIRAILVKDAAKGVAAGHAVKLAREHVESEYILAGEIVRTQIAAPMRTYRRCRTGTAVSPRPYLRLHVSLRAPQHRTIGLSDRKGMESEEVDKCECLFKGMDDQVGRNVAQEGDGGRTGELVRG